MAPCVFSNSWMRCESVTNTQKLQITIQKTIEAVAIPLLDLLGADLQNDLGSLIVGDANDGVHELAYVRAATSTL